MGFIAEKGADDHVVWEKRGPLPLRLLQRGRKKKRLLDRNIGGKKRASVVSKKESS